MTTTLPSAEWFSGMIHAYAEIKSEIARAEVAGLDAITGELGIDELRQSADKASAAISEFYARLVSRLDAAEAVVTASKDYLLSPSPVTIGPVGDALDHYDAIIVV